MTLANKTNVATCTKTLVTLETVQSMLTCLLGEEVDPLSCLFESGYIEKKKRMQKKESKKHFRVLRDITVPTVKQNRNKMEKLFESFFVCFFSVLSYCFENSM